MLNPTFVFGKEVRGNNLKYSLVVPVYKDANLADDFVVEFNNVFRDFLQQDDISNYVELIFVLDGGTRKDEDTLKDICQRYAFTKSIILSRNFGQHIALTAGYSKASGQFVGILNIDQQDPISELPKFLAYIEKHNLDIVYGLRNGRSGPWRDEITSMIFNIILNKLTGSKTPLNVSTMRVMSRRFVDAYNKLKESERFLPGLENWLGFDAGYVDTIHVERKRGKSSYTFKTRLNMARNAILSFSDYPLRLMVTFGFILSILGVIGVLVIIVLRAFFLEFQAGYASLISVIILSSGIIVFVMGFSSLYIGKILKEVQQRPAFVIKDLFNFRKDIEGLNNQSYAIIENVLSEDLKQP